LALLGFEENEYPGVADSFRAQLHPEDRERVFAAFMAHLKERKPFDEEFRHRCKDGSIRHFRARGQALWDDNGKATRMAGSITDITERKEFERKLAEARDAAETANLAKSQFLANMSHELRTPLNSVIGFSNVLLKNMRNGFNSEDLSFLRRIRDNGIHLLSLINEVLDISKVEAGRTELDMGLVRLDRIVHEALSSLEGAALEKNIALTAEIPDEVDAIPADEKRLKQVLINLLGNAVKFTERGEVAVRLRTAVGSRRPERVEVSDTGIGIPQGSLPRIFDAFHQADASTTRKHGGTGLGLAISRSLCRLMGFELVAVSEVGRGSTFTIMLDAGAQAARRAEGAADGARARR
jgi:PAS domain S-box-containing protein